MQHYRNVNIFKGESVDQSKERDKAKSEYCAENGKKIHLYRLI